MKLKYYLRGLGIGILVTAVIMSVTNKPQEMTDDQIKIRALELGMVEKSVLADLQKKEDTNVETVDDVLNQHVEEKEEQVQEDMSAADTKETIEEADVEDVGNVITAGNADTEIKEGGDKQTADKEEISIQDINFTQTEADVEKQAEEVSGGENTIEDEVVESYTIINVEKGNGSEIISRKLFEAGMVESAIEYNQFLVRNGYDRRLSVGNHEIPAGASYEDIARILCRIR